MARSKRVLGKVPAQPKRSSARLRGKRQAEEQEEEEIQENKKETLKVNK